MASLLTIWSEIQSKPLRYLEEEWFGWENGTHRSPEVGMGAGVPTTYKCGADDDVCWWGGQIQNLLTLGKECGSFSKYDEKAPFPLTRKYCVYVLHRGETLLSCKTEIQITTYCELSSLFILLSSRIWRFLTLSKRSSSAWISASSWKWREGTITSSIYLWYKKDIFTLASIFYNDRKNSVL